MRIQRMSDDAIASTLGQAIRERRLRKNISQDGLAELVGISSPTLGKLENGKGTIANLISTLRGLGALDLLAPMMTPPPVSPLAVSRASTSTKRIRASSPKSTDSLGQGQRVKTGPSASINSLLIPKKNIKGHDDDGQDS